MIRFPAEERSALRAGIAEHDFEAWTDITEGSDSNPRPAPVARTHYFHVYIRELDRKDVCYRLADYRGLGERQGAFWPINAETVFLNVESRRTAIA